MSGPSPCSFKVIWFMNIARLLASLLEIQPQVPPDPPNQTLRYDKSSVIRVHSKVLGSTGQGLLLMRGDTGATGHKSCAQG